MYRPDQRPDVEVRRDGAWHQGKLRDWQQREDGWWANVQWRPKVGMTFIDTVPADDVRLDQVSRPARTVAAPVELLATAELGTPLPR